MSKGAATPASKPVADHIAAKSPAMKKAGTATPPSKHNSKMPAAEKAARPVVSEKPAKPPKPAPDTTPRREKLVRDSFTMPKSEYAVLDGLKQRAAELTRPAKKSELLRAGVKALAALDAPAFLEALQAVPAIKTGRPKA